LRAAFLAFVRERPVSIDDVTPSYFGFRLMGRSKGCSTMCGVLFYNMFRAKPRILFGIAKNTHV
jgi:hypothetical protein